jgi:hypothetical protein
LASKKSKASYATSNPTPVAPKRDMDKEALDLVVDCRDEAIEFYDDKFKQFSYFDRLYTKGACKTNVPYGRANLELPLAFQQIEPFVAQMMEATIGEKPYMPFAGRMPDDDAKAQLITEYTQYQLDTGGYVPALEQSYRNLGKYGSRVMKVVWDTDVVEVEDEQDVQVPELNPTTGQVEIVTKTQTNKIDVTKHDGPCFYNVSLFHFFIPKNAVDCNTQKMDWNIHEVFRNPEDLLNNPNYTKNKSKVKDFLKSKTVSGTLTNKTSASYKSKITESYQDQTNKKSGMKYNEQVRVLEWWGKFNFGMPESPDFKEALIVVAYLNDEPVLLRLDENPFKFKFKPFIMSNDYPIEGDPYGYGELNHIKGLIEESTALRNARLDAANLSLNRMWIVERQAGINLRDLFVAPNNIILTNDKAGIAPIDMGGVTPSSVQELSRIDYDIQNTTEILNPRQDVSNVGAAFGSTATGINFLSSRNSSRMISKLRLQEETFFKPLAQMLQWYNKDFVTSDSFFRTEESQSPYTIGPDSFASEVDYIPRPAPEKFSRAALRENMAYLLQVVGQVEKVAPGTNNLPKLMEDVYRLSGFPHPQEYVLPKQTTVMQLPTGQLADTKGQPVQVVSVGPDGKPVPPQGPPLQ